MKRFLIAFMLLATTASAERLAVVKPYFMPGTVSPPEYSFSERDLVGVLDAMGVDYDLLPQSALHGNKALTATSQDLDFGLGAGSISIGGVTKNYGGALHFWWGGGFSRAWGYNPDTLTRVAAWPTKPQLFMGPPTITGSTQWSTSSTCSTGIGAGSGAFPFGDGEGTSAPSGTKANGRASSMYLAGSQLVWKNWNGQYNLGFGSLSGWPGITRGIVGMKTMLGPGQYETCNACDGGARPDPPDSVTIWYRQRTTGTGKPYGARLIFAWPAAIGTNNGAIMQYVMAIAALDSAAGGTLIGKVPGWTPLKLAIFLDKAGYHSNYTTSGNDDDHGLYRPDSTKTWAMADSVDALGVPYGVGWHADRDTMAAYPYEIVRLKRLRNARFSPQVFRGAFTTSAPMGNSTARNRVDVWGTQRSRLLYSSPTPYVPTTTDSSLFAGLWFGRALTDSVFPGRASAALYPPRGDWVPNQFTRANLPDKNELAATLWAAKYRVLIIDPDNPDTNPNPSFGTATGGTFVGPSTAIDGLFAAERVVNVYADSTYSLSGGFGGASQSQQPIAGSVFFAGARPMRSESGAINLSLTHNYSEELFWGAFTGNWYRTDIAYYYHYFHTPLHVLLVPFGYLGGDATGNNRAAGWWQIKHMVNQVKAVNRIAGRTVIRIVEPGEL